MVGSYHNRKFAIMVFAIMVGSYHNRKFAIMVFAIMVWNHIYWGMGRISKSLGDKSPIPSGFAASHLTMIYVCTYIRLSVPLGCSIKQAGIIIHKILKFCGKHQESKFFFEKYQTVFQTVATKIYLQTYINKHIYIYII